MQNDSKLKIVFFTFYSTSVLRQYWRCLNDKADCWWATFSPYCYAELKEIGYKKVFFKNMLFKKFNPTGLGRIINKINLFYAKCTIRGRINKMVNELAPHILITNTTKWTSRYNPNKLKVMKVQVFHSVPYKKYCLDAENLKYDLVLLPSEYHKGRICERLNVSDIDKLKVVGWPRVDSFINKKFTKRDRDILTKKLGLNPEFKNVLYAPTWNAFYRNGLFPKSFGFTVDAFEEFCKRLKELNVNLIVKWHPAALRLIRDTRLHRIAEKYNVHLAYKSSPGHLDNSAMEYFLWLTDVLISDVSGIIIDFMVLNRPIVYIEPDKKDMKWEEADLPKEFRAGDVVKSMEELIESVKRALQNPNRYKLKREEILKKVFYKLDGRASERASDAILDYYKIFSA